MKRIIWHFTLGNGKNVRVTYYPRWSYCYKPELKYRTDHFEFHGEAISATGYRSEFTMVDPEPSFDGTTEAHAFARRKITELSGIGFEDWQGQLDLF